MRRSGFNALENVIHPITHRLSRIISFTLLRRNDDANKGTEMAIILPCTKHSISYLPWVMSAHNRIIRIV